MKGVIVWVIRYQDLLYSLAHNWEARKSPPMCRCPEAAAYGVGGREKRPTI
jgi:hypothetical protein